MLICDLSQEKESYKRPGEEEALGSAGVNMVTSDDTGGNVRKGTEESAG